jgi:OOP family OmpA-OmpF porin
LNLQHTSLRRATGLIVALSAALALTACGAEQRVSFSSESSPVVRGAVGSPSSGAGSSNSSAGDATDPDGAAAAPGRNGTMGNGRDIPSIPEIVVPDVTEFDKTSNQIATSFGEVADPQAGVTVTGARCDSAGRVVNRASLTLVDHGDGSGTVSEGATDAQNNGDGSGTYSSGAQHIVVNKDGSGRYEYGAKTILINADGTGSYDYGALSVEIGKDGAGSYSSGAKSIVNHGDGSGVYEYGALKVVNNGDGSGSYDYGATSVVNDGHGSGTYESGATSETRRMDPLPPLPKVGHFPPVKSIKPLGRSCGTLIRLEDRVLFDFDSATLRPEAGPVMDAVAKAMPRVTGEIQVNGHTDAVGTDAYNLDLSRRRAQAVAAALTARGVTAKIAAEGFGEKQPIAPNTVGGKDNPTGRQLNRRVEIVVPAR